MFIQAIVSFRGIDLRTTLKLPRSVYRILVKYQAQPSPYLLLVLSLTEQTQVSSSPIRNQIHHFNLKFLLFLCADCVQRLERARLESLVNVTTVGFLSDPLTF